ncbi:MAG: CARDB domain-containing protein [Baekduia sp.]
MRSRARMPMSLAVLAALLLAPAGPTAGATQQPARPDLVIASGAVNVVAGGKLSGRFVVANRGPVRAARSTAALSVRANHRWQAIKRFTLPRLAAASSARVTITAALPRALPVGRLALRVCADSRQTVRERSNTNNCTTIGALRITSAPTRTPTAAPIPGPVPAPTPAPPAPGTSAPVAPIPDPPAPVIPPPPPSRPASSVPAAPIAFTKNQVFKLTDVEGGYWITVPTSYDATHATPITLFVWMHGCQAKDADDIFTISPGGDQQHYIAISPDGREGDCWYPDIDMPKVLAAIADVKTHFNVDPRRVIVGGYSSGGDLAYRTAFYNAYTFAGVLGLNTSPFRGTGSTQAQSLAAAYWKFHVVQLAHTEDSSYPIDDVRAETDALTAAGFPVLRIERPGAHFAPDTATTGTYHDLVSILLPHIDDGWLAPP